MHEAHRPNTVGISAMGEAGKTILLTIHTCMYNCSHVDSAGTCLHKEVGFHKG